MKQVIVVVMIALFGVNCKGQNEKNIVYDTKAATRDAKNFNAIEVSGAIDLYLSQGTVEAVAVSGSSDEVTAKIKTEVTDGVLKIYVEERGFGWKSWGNGKMKAYVTFKNINKIEASGACNIKATQPIKETDLKIELSGASDFLGEIAVNNIDLETSGASNIKVSGSANTSLIDASGACSIKAYDLKTAYSKVSASGASNIKVTVAKELSVDASGGSSIMYKGSGIIKSVDTSGGASVKKADE